jgi:hypothetical protein
MEFLDSYFYILVIIILVWFKRDCRIQKRFILDRFEVFLYYLFSIFTTMHFWSNGLGGIIK